MRTIGQSSRSGAKPQEEEIVKAKTSVVTSLSTTPLPLVILSVPSPVHQTTIPPHTTFPIN